MTFAIHSEKKLHRLRLPRHEEFEIENRKPSKTVYVKNHLEIKAKIRAKSHCEKILTLFKMEIVWIQLIWLNTYQNVWYLTLVHL